MSFGDSTEISYNIVVDNQAGGKRRENFKRKERSGYASEIRKNATTQILIMKENKSKLTEGS